VAKPYVDAILAARTSGGDFGSTQDNLWALTALQGYFASLKPSAGPSTRVTLTSALETPTAEVESRVLASSRKRPYAQASLRVDEPNTRLTIAPERNAGSGRIIGRLSYHPRAEKHQPVAAGLELTRRLLDHATGTPVAALRQGQLVIVELTLSSDDAWQQVALVDRLPAGLEAVDLELVTAPRGIEVQERDYTWVYREVHDERVAFFSNWLSAEPHVVRYVARATRTGTFVHPPPYAEAMYQPDVYGVGAIGSVVVK
jgi:uncharacterized protein YfaS (alpha-2-macroglobulin family)